MAHDSTTPYNPEQVLHLGVDNTHNTTTTTAIKANVTGAGASALRVYNGNFGPFGFGGEAIHGQVSSASAGVVGLNRHPSGSGIFGQNFDTGGGTGVIGRADNGTGVLGDSNVGPGVRGNANFGTGVYGLGGAHGVRGEAFLSGSVGVLAENAHGGIGLRVVGRASFSMCGGDAVPTGQASQFVANASVAASSHITVTLTGDPGRANLQWVERQPGTGFVVHMSRSVATAVPFTYLIVEP
jgi:hypothetical protein